MKISSNDDTTPSVPATLSAPYTNISIYSFKVLDGITYTLPNFNGANRRSLGIDK